MFQVNRSNDSSTAPEEIQDIADSELKSARTGRKTDHWMWIEIILIALCFGLFAGQLPPDVNESHYLTKAKHFWNPAWCPNDIFLSSSFSHLLFYLSAGWITKFCSLTVFAWIGRIGTWLLLAVAWQRLSNRLIPNRGVAFLSAMFFMILNDQFHMAGEWVIGGFEAKGIAFAFVIFAMERMVSGNWPQSWILFGIASAFHVLVGGWATLAALTSWVCCELWRKNPYQLVTIIKSNMVPLLIGFAIALVGILPPLITEWGTSEVLSREASRIYVETRISHHLQFDSFPTIHIARFAMICLAWISFAYFLRYLESLRPIHVFCVASLLISFGGLMLSGIEEQGGSSADFARSLLRFYWFRLSDFAVPLALSLSCAAIVSRWLRGEHGTSKQCSAWLFVIMILTAAGILVWEKNVDPRPVADQRSLPAYPSDVRTIETHRNWIKVCDWIRANTDSSAVFITPADQQTFKWYSGRTEVACWKDVPQDAESMSEWHRRINLLYYPQREFEGGLLGAYNDEQLKWLAEEFAADYLVVPQKELDLVKPATKLEQIYPENPESKSTYVVLKLR